MDHRFIHFSLELTPLTRKLIKIVRSQKIVGSQKMVSHKLEIGQECVIALKLKFYIFTVG